MSDVNSPVFFGLLVLLRQITIFFSIFCFNKRISSQHYPYLGKKLTHLDVGSLRELLLFHTKLSIIYENGSKYAVI